MACRCMHDEASPFYTEMIDQTTRGHQFLKKNFGDSAIPRGTWQARATSAPAPTHTHAHTHTKLAQDTPALISQPGSFAKSSAVARYRRAWCVCVLIGQIDPFGHSNTEAWLLGSEAGFESLFWGRTDYQVTQAPHTRARQPNSVRHVHRAMRASTHTTPAGSATRTWRGGPARRARLPTSTRSGSGKARSRSESPQNFSPVS